MTKEELMELARQYARFYMTFDETIAKQKLSDAYDAALAKARRDALEEAAKVCDSLIHYGEVSGVLCAKQIRALLSQEQIVKKQPVNDTDLTPPEQDIEGHPV